MLCGKSFRSKKRKYTMKNEREEREVWEFWRWHAARTGLTWSVEAR